MSLKFLLWAISLHSYPSWIRFTSNLPSFTSYSSSFYSCPFFFITGCSWYWLFQFRLVSVSSNSMESPVKIPHTTPWYNFFERVIRVIQCKSIYEDGDEQRHHPTDHPHAYYLPAKLNGWLISILVFVLLWFLFLRCLFLLVIISISACPCLQQ